MLLRPLLFLGFSALLLVPDWSTARPFRRSFAYAPAPCPVAYSYPAPVVSYYAPPVVYSAPVAYAPPLVYGTPVCQMTVAPAVPVASVPATPPGPRVFPERTAEPKAAEPKPTIQPKSPEPKPEAQAPPPRVIQTVGNEERLPPMPVPLQPRPVADPQPLPRLPVDFAQPKAITEESQKPAPIPATPEPAKPAADLPQFELPPLPELAPPKTTAKSSPLNADGVADVYPVAGPAPADRAAARTVGFVNKSARDVILTVAGRMTTLPRGQYLQLKLPAQFAWQIGGEPARDVTVPDTAPGVDVIIRR